MIQNSLIAKDGMLSFDATMTQDISYMEQDGQIRHYMYYRENNSQIDLYYKWEMLNPDTSVDTMFELWYNGTVDEGIITIDYNDAEIDNDVHEGELIDIDTYNYQLAQEGALLIEDTINYIDIAGIQSLSNVSAYSGTLTKNADIYTFSRTGATITYSNNKLTSVNSVNFAFDTTNTIPTAPVVE